ncbi:hypothetical protein LAG90_00700 [Marinilongibacter aquaticus]|uniref:hypothetical protein n=1 Tax=Marinilongibacter aquaticus TaxID=2975157 RepID=UPI0021BD6B39|nr:hypothetical protein [Marinilongibacter aquaticus]UBM59177.1 hypothetical protein LAG90_00700 [Marinilongibacter aquaticus]
MKEQDEIDKAFRQSFEGFKPEIPKDSWSKVKEGIAKAELEKALRWKTRYKYLSLFLGALVLFSGVFYTFSDQDNKGLGADERENNALSELKRDTVYVERFVQKTDTVFVRSFVSKKTSDIDIEKVLQNELLFEQVVSYAEKQGYSVKRKALEEPSPRIIPNFTSPNTLRSLAYGQVLVHPFRAVSRFNSVSSANTRIKKEKVPLKNRLFFQGLIGQGVGKLIVPKGNDIFGSNSSKDFGFYGGIRLSDRFWMKTGIRVDHQNYTLESEGRIRLEAEHINQNYQFVYRSPLGNLVIPNEALSFPARQGASLEIESHNNNRGKQLVVPIQFNYDFLSKDVRFLGYFRPLELYAGLNAYIQKPLKNKVSLEIYEHDGSEFDLTLDKFSSLSNLSVGAGMQTGAKLEIYPGWKLMLELQAHRNLTYTVNNEYFKSFRQGLSLSGGIEIRFK